jgi:imidazolonepropionase-like amidohydrolase
MRILVMLWLSIGFGLLLTPISDGPGQPAAVPIVITHVTVINPNTSTVQANRTVVITGEQITSVSDAAKLQLPQNARVIDATGQYLIPGLWGMHVHSAFGDWFPGDAR